MFLAPLYLRTHIGALFGNSGQQFVRLPFLLKSLVQERHGLIMPELFRPLFQGAVSRDLVVFYGLGRRDETRIESLAVGVLLHDALAFLDNSLDGFASLSLGASSQQFEHLVKPLDMGLRLIAMRLKCLPEIV